jgi:hypothetical protein
MSEPIRVLDHGLVRLIDSMGRDITDRLSKNFERASRDKPLFLIQLEKMGELRAAAHHVSVSINTISGWMKRDHSFKEAVAAILRLWKGVDGIKKCSSCLEAKPGPSSAIDQIGRTSEQYANNALRKTTDSSTKTKSNIDSLSSRLVAQNLVQQACQSRATSQPII